MNIAIIGTGRIGLSLAQKWSDAGHTIVLGSRTSERGVEALNQLGNPPSISAGPIRDSVEAADVVLFAFPWYALTDVEREIGACEGKTIIDCINPITSSGSLALGHKRSAGEEIQSTFRKAQVVKALNHIHFSHFENPIFDGQPADAFYCTDHDKAGEIIETLTSEIGFRPVYLGPMKHARYLEPLAMIWIQSAYFLGRGTEFTIRFVDR